MKKSLLEIGLAVQVDISYVYKIIQDYSNKQIEVKNKERVCLWEQKYSSESTFNKAFREINKKFSIELKRRATAALVNINNGEENRHEKHRLYV